MLVNYYEILVIDPDAIEDEIHIEYLERLKLT